MLLLLSFYSMYAPASLPPGHPGGFFTLEDYPPEAMREHWEGTAIAELRIDPQGHVSGCQIVQSAGHEVLDDATCNLLTKRLRFTPAKDGDGKPIEGKYRTPPITWRLAR